QKELKVCFFAVLPALGFVLEQRFERAGDGGRTLRVAQFVNDHRGGERFSQERLRHAHVTINADDIDDADAASGRGGNRKTTVFAAGRKQEEGVPRTDLERLCQARTDDDSVGVVAKLVEVS